MRTEEQFAKVFSYLTSTRYDKAKNLVKSAISDLRLRARVRYDETTDVLLGSSENIERVWEHMKKQVRF